IYQNPFKWMLKSLVVLRLQKKRNSLSIVSLECLFISFFKIILMKKFLFIVSFISCQFVFSQPDSLFFKTEDITIPKWSHKNKASALISEVAFINWNAGGSNSISALFSFESALKYSYKHRSEERRVGKECRTR